MIVAPRRQQIASRYFGFSNGISGAIVCAFDIVLSQRRNEAKFTLSRGPFIQAVMDVRSRELATARHTRLVLGNVYDKARINEA